MLCYVDECDGACRSSSQLYRCSCCCCRRACSSIGSPTTPKIGNGPTSTLHEIDGQGGFRARFLLSILALYINGPQIMVVQGVVGTSKRSLRTQFWRTTVPTRIDRWTGSGSLSLRTTGPINILLSTVNIGRVRTKPCSQLAVHVRTCFPSWIFSFLVFLN